MLVGGAPHVTIALEQVKYGRPILVHLIQIILNQLPLQSTTASL